MTLILAQVGSRWVVQVSDRLVSRVGDGTARPHDSDANKVVILVCKNGIVTIAYTGLSYIHGVPTDRWIAELLRGHKPKEFQGRPALQEVGRGPRANLDVGRQLLDLAGALTHLAARHPHWKQAPIQLLVTGWQWNRQGLCRPVGLKLSQDSTGAYVVERTVRNQPERQYRLFCVPDGHLAQHELGSCARSLASMDPWGAERALVDAIQTVALRSAVVGTSALV
jgi:hypothetical protein